MPFMALGIPQVVITPISDIMLSILRRPPHVGFESWLERDRVMALDFDPDVVGLSSQPFRLSWQAGGKTRSHIPDYFVRLRDGSGVVRSPVGIIDGLVPCR